MLKEVFSGIAPSYTILLALILIDTITGIITAMALKRLGSRGLIKLTNKFITYTLSVLSVRLFEISIENLYQTIVFSHLVMAFLAIAELVSILENLTILGVPLPANLINILTNRIKIPGWGNLPTIYNTGKDFTEIDEMIKYHLPNFTNQSLQKLLLIKFDVWKSIVLQLKQIFHTNQGNVSKELLYYKVLSIIELGFYERNAAWQEEGIPKICIEAFLKWHQSKVDLWLQKVKNICFSDRSLAEKEDLIQESIIVILYQTILDGHKGLECLSYNTHTQDKI